LLQATMRSGPPAGSARIGLTCWMGEAIVFLIPRCNDLWLCLLNSKATS